MNEKMRQFCLFLSLFSSFLNYAPEAICFRNNYDILRNTVMNVRMKKFSDSSSVFTVL